MENNGPAASLSSSTTSTEREDISLDHSGLQSPKESSSELKVPETQTEIDQTETMTKQLSTTWTGDGQRSLESRLSRTFPDGYSGNVTAKEESSLSQCQGSAKVDSIGFREFSPMLRTPSSLLGDIPAGLSLNHSPSSNLISMGIPLYQRNPSYEGNYVPDLTSYSITIDGGLLPVVQAVPQEGQNSDADRLWRSAGERQVVDGICIDVLDRNESISLDPVSELKRQRSATPAPVKSIPKLARQNTEMEYAQTYQSPNRPDHALGDGVHMILTANVNGVDYQSEIKKKDKRDPKKWTKEEDELLRQAVREFGEKQWKVIAQRIPGRNHVQCLQRWKKVLRPGLKKGHWTDEEDNLLRLYRDKCSNWAEVAEKIPGRTAKQCRERWCNHVDPNVRKGDWSTEEDHVIVCLQEQWGNRWSAIAEQLPGRSENAVKIRWKTLCRKGIPESYHSTQKLPSSKAPTSTPSVGVSPQKASGTQPSLTSLPSLYLPAGSYLNVPMFPLPQHFYSSPDPQQPPYANVTSLEGSSLGLPVYSQVNPWFGSDGMSRPLSFNYTSPPPTGDTKNNMMDYMLRFNSPDGQGPGEDVSRLTTFSTQPTLSNQPSFSTLTDPLDGHTTNSGSSEPLKELPSLG